ncbi:hypothetical protein HG536_0D05620 [Torulaspora globosa]|uniref:Uncharacterized protein n=1 Tax=Torulaspora globosa TaxID=48254 RepID=A0A7G3ZHQ5_9SACH|nr:uncharacterized protein HG536_0D05620 [Torulaspora globosa]QLL33041.1 hypothetical protein HG536_0D05620 [Torulaspora globosa]
MDPYSLKRDNRKKFQDKQRLKHRHATPSDRKYRSLKFQENQNEKKEAEENGDEGEEEVQPPSNEYRYHEDISMTFEHPAELERDLKASKKIREILRSKKEQEEPLAVSSSTKETVTTKSLHSMAVDDLNGILGGQTTSSNRGFDKPVRRISPTADKSASKAPEKTKSAASTVPDELQSAQDFLDDLI